MVNITMESECFNEIRKKTNQELPISKLRVPELQSGSTSLVNVFFNITMEMRSTPGAFVNSAIVNEVVVRSQLSGVTRFERENSSTT